MKLQKLIKVYRREGDIKEWHLVRSDGLRTACGLQLRLGHTEETLFAEISCYRCRKTNAWKKLEPVVESAAGDPHVE